MSVGETTVVRGGRETQGMGVHGAGGVFPATQWSVISQARGVDDGRVAEGLRRLAVGYWRPLYVFLRKRGESHEDASDSVQGFFAFVLGSNFLEYVERDGGKFRSYLLKSLERWRGRERGRAGAQKRGGGVEHVPLNGVEAMEGLAVEDGESAEAAFDRQWATEMVARAVNGLRAEYAGRGRGDWFDGLRAGLPGGGGEVDYGAAAASLGAAEGTVRKAAFDLRQAFAAKLREEIRATVQTNEDAEEELRHLVAALAGGRG